MRRSLSARQTVPGPSSRTIASAVVVSTRTRSSTSVLRVIWVTAKAGGSKIPSTQAIAASAQSATMIVFSHLIPASRAVTAGDSFTRVGPQAGRLRLAADDQELLAQEAPGERRFQVAPTIQGAVGRLPLKEYGRYWGIVRSISKPAL